jgi:hypothetical protein
VLRRLVILSVLAGVLAAPASAQAIVVGFGDQKPDMFLDTRFQELGIKHARIAVPWDWRKHDWQIEELDRWFFFARAQGVYPARELRQVARRPARAAVAVAMKYEMRQFRKRWPFVLNFATWNEANHCGEPTCHRPKLVASYWRKLQEACRRCKILAAELIDLPNVVKWAQEFRRHSRREPAVWGLHNYIEANRFRTTYLERLLEEVKGTIWLTEVGGIVKRRGTKRTQKHRVKGIPESTKHAAKVTRYLFDEVLPLSPRITRVYLYHWNSATPWDSWDSGFIGWDRKPRPAFRVLQRELAELRAARSRR